MRTGEPKVFVIAEAGVNHNGQLALAKDLVDAAVAAGADAVKFQTFKAEDVISVFAPKAEYQKRTTGGAESQLEMVRKYQLGEAAHVELIGHCATAGIKFTSTPGDLGSIDLLVRLGLDVLKIPAGDVTNLPYLRKIGGLRKRLILSSGMSDLREVGEALEVLISAGTCAQKITVLHCNTEYPTPFEDVNLNAMKTIAKEYGVSVGYSDHTLGIEVPIAAVALGALTIEKHLTLSKDMEGPDHKASLEPDEFRAMVTAIRNIEKALGDGVKRTSDSERKNLPIARKSIVAVRDIRKGEILIEENITVKRPGTGISPMRWDDVIGTVAQHDFIADQLIDILEYGSKE